MTDPLNMTLRERHKARPYDVLGGEHTLKQCAKAGIPAFHKQMGHVPVMDEAVWRALGPKSLLSAAKHNRAPEGSVVLKFTDKGEEPAEWPPRFRVQQFPIELRRPR